MSNLLTIPKRYRILAVVLLLAAAIFWLTTQYVFVAGALYPKNALRLDLRSEELTEEDYHALKQKLPGCEIVWNVEFQGKTYPSDIQLLEVTTLSPEDVLRLDYFPKLTMLDAEFCTDYDALLAFQSRRPNCNVRYRVTVNGRSYLNMVGELRLHDAEIWDLDQLLPYMPRVRSVLLTGQLPTLEEIRKVQEALSEIEFRWEIEFQDLTVEHTVQSLDLSGRTLDLEETAQMISRLPDLTHVDLQGCSLTDDERMALADRFPQCFFLWDVTFGEVTVTTDAEEIDISGQKLENTEQVEVWLPYFPNLKKVVMGGCGFDNETMDALNKRHEDVQFVWTIQIQYVTIRTDATWFYPFKYSRDLYVNSRDLYPLRYCTDMVCIDIGHMYGVTECEWAAFMPNLKYLIIGETSISDLTPLSGLKNLVYLEMFTVPVTDYSPLVGCTGLEDLNLGKTYGSPEPIAKMTWLKNLWWCDSMTQGRACSNAKEILDEALPNTTIKYYPEHPTASGWRELDNYFAMRDYLDMFYLD